MRTRLTPLAWFAGLGLAHVGLVAAGAALPTPAAPWSPARFATWVTATDPSVASFSVLRVVALAITWYLLAVTTLAVLGRIRGLRPLGVVADRLSLPPVRRVVHHMVGVGLTLSIAGGAVPAFAITPASATTGPAITSPARASTTGMAVPEQRVTMKVIGGDGGTTAAVAPPPTRGLAGPGVPSTVRMTVLDESTASAATSTPPAAAPSSPASTTPANVVPSTMASAPAATVPSSTDPTFPPTTLVGPPSPASSPSGPIGQGPATSVPVPGSPAAPGPGSIAPAPGGSRSTAPAAPSRSPPTATPTPRNGVTPSQADDPSDTRATNGMTDAPVVHMRVLNDGPMPADLSVAINADVRTSDQRAPAPASDARPGSTDAVAPADVPGSGSWTIEAGDHLWHVAESTVTRVLGRPAPAATTLAYLDLLIDSNRARLVVADNADLVFPGQIFTLPSVPPALLVT